MATSLIGILFLLGQTYLSFQNPKYFFSLYLLYISSFFGFIPNEIIISGFDIGLYYQNLLFIIHLILNFSDIKKQNKNIRIFLYWIILFYIFGIAYPVMDGNIIIKESLIGSKEFSCLFLIHYLLIYNRFFTFNYIRNIISFFGYYFTMVLLFFVLFQISPPEYVKEINNIEIDYPTILSLFIFIESGLAKTISKRIFILFLVAIWSIGMYYEGHAAIMLTTTLGSLIILLRIPIMNLLSNMRLFVFGMLITFIIILNAPKLLISFNDTGAIQSRLITNLDRIEMIMEKPLFGNGFFSYNTFEFEANNKYGRYISTIDNGYIDFIIKFGLVGLILYLILYTFLIIRAKNDLLNTSLKIFLIQYIFVNVTWSVFLYSIGNIALCIAIFALYKNKNVNTSKDSNRIVNFEIRWK